MAIEEPVPDAAWLAEDKGKVDEDAEESAAEVAAEAVVVVLVRLRGFAAVDAFRFTVPVDDIVRYGRNRF